MTREPNDDILRNFAKAMEDIISSLPVSENARFLGCTIISGNSGDPFVFRSDDEGGAGDDEVDYEVIDSPDKIYVTVALPPDVSKIPDVDIQPDFVMVVVDGVEIKVDLPSSVNVDQSHFMAKNGILDIVCEKTF